MAVEKETAYRYQKRINELREDRNRLQSYRALAMLIFDAATENKEGLSSFWIIRQFRNLLK